MVSYNHRSTYSKYLWVNEMMIKKVLRKDAYSNLFK